MADQYPHYTTHPPIPRVAALTLAETALTPHPPPLKGEGSLRDDYRATRLPLRAVAISLSPKSLSG